MESAAYERGKGGKFRRRKTRRPAATPYDRPPSAVRGLRGIATEKGRGCGRLSKLVDPGSRFISRSASKLFSSVFEQNSQVRQLLDVPETVDSAPIELHGQEMVYGQNPIKNVHTHGISEIEQLLKQKTYTRAQVDYLTELIRIRTIEPPRPESETNNEKVLISHKGNGIRSSGLNKHLSTSAADLSVDEHTDQMKDIKTMLQLPSSGFSFSSIVSGSNSCSGLSSIGSSTSSSGLSSTGSSTSCSGFSFSVSAAGSQTPTSSISSSAAALGLFGSSSLGSTSSNSGSVFGSSPSTGFSFGLTAPASGVPSFGFGSSPGSVFSFVSAGSTMLAGTATPVFGVQSPAGCSSSISQNNDQMSIEGTMADNTSQAPAPLVSTFGQPNSAPASSNFMFLSAGPSGRASVFQFGNNQNPNPFQSSGNLEFASGGSFSLGSGCGEKSARKIVKVRRDKIRRK